MKSTSRLSDTPWYEYLIVGAFVIVIMYVGYNLYSSTGYGDYFDKEYIDGYGSFVGGFAGVIGIYYLYKTLKSQNESQQLASFENRYIQLITFHRDLTYSLRIENTSQYADARIEGRALFGLILKMVDEARVLVNSSFKDNDIQSIYKSDSEYNKDCKIWGANNVALRTEINIAYLITFIGVSSVSIDLLKKTLKKHYADAFSDSIVERFQQILKGETNDEEKKNPLSKAKDILNNEKKYAGVQDVLGNYFRLLYNTVCYLHEQKWIDKEDRYTYAKMLRCQLTDNEEILLFYNSLSDFGTDWEYNGDKDKSLITEYQLIKNISMHVDEAKRFYPKVAYEKL